MELMGFFFYGSFAIGVIATILVFKLPQLVAVKKLLYKVFKVEEAMKGPTFIERYFLSGVLLMYMYVYLVFSALSIFLLTKDFEALPFVAMMIVFFPAAFRSASILEYTKRKLIEKFSKK